MGTTRSKRQPAKTNGSSTANNSNLTAGNVSALPDNTQPHQGAVAELRHKFDHGSNSTSTGTSVGTSAGTSAVNSKKALTEQQKKISPISTPAKTPLEQQSKVVDTTKTSVASSVKDLNELNRPISFAGVTTVSGSNAHADGKSSEVSVVNSVKDLNDLNRPLSFAGETTVSGSNDANRKSKTFVGDRGNIDTWAKNPSFSPENSQHPEMKNLSPTTAGMVASLDGMMGTSPEQNKLSMEQEKENSNMSKGNDSSLDSMMGTSGQQSQAAGNSASVPTVNCLLSQGDKNSTACSVSSSTRAEERMTAGQQQQHSSVSGVATVNCLLSQCNKTAGAEAPLAEQQKNISEQPKEIDPAVVNSEEGLTHDKFDAIKYKFNHPVPFHKEAVSTDLKKENFNAIKDKFNHPVPYQKEVASADVKKEDFNAAKELFSHGSSAPVPSAAGKAPLHTHQFDENAENKKPVNSM